MIGEFTSNGTVMLRARARDAAGNAGDFGPPVALRIESVTGDALSVEEGSLYPALYRMAAKGWITAEWGLSENNRRAKYYRLTGAGRRQLRRQTSGWQRFAGAVDKAITSTIRPALSK